MKTTGWIALMAVAIGGCSGGKIPYTSAAGRYRIDMPGKFEESVKDIPTLLGNIKANIVVSHDSRNCLYTVMHADYPAGIMRLSAPDAVLDGAVAGAIRESNSKELETKKGTLYGHPGREMTFEARSSTGAKGIGRSRIFLVENRMYQILVVGPEGDATPEVAKAFFDSFSLLDKVKPVATDPASSVAPGPPVIDHALSPLPPAKAALAGWGTLVDPLNDCQTQVIGDALTITVPGKLHDFNPPPGSFDAPRMLQDVTGDFTADVQVPEEPRPGGKSVGAGLPYHGAGLVVWIDESNFVRLERAGILRGNDVTSYALFEGRNSGQRFGRDGFMPPGGTWLRLQRKGGTISAFAGSDGRTWSPPLGSENVSWPAAAKVGVMAVNSADRAYAAKFRGLKIAQP